MLPAKTIKWSIVLSLLPIVAAVKAAPAISRNNDNYIALASSSIKHTYSHPVGQISYTSEVYNFHPASIVSEFLKLRASFTRFGFHHKNIWTLKTVFNSNQYDIYSVIEQLGTGTEQHIGFAPAFIFENLPRGPPALT